MKTANTLFQSFVILVCVCALLLTGCSALSVVTYPEAQQLPEGTLKSKNLPLEHAKASRMLVNGIEFSKDDLRVFVTADSRREYPVTIGPIYVPIIPAFWLDWFLDPSGDKTLKLKVDFSSWREKYDFDPTQFVIVQDGNELKPIKTSELSGVFGLEYESSSWEFILKLRGIRNQSGAVVLPDIHFSRGLIWVFSIAP